MKGFRLYLFAFLLSLGSFAYAQRGGNEVVYLKNGSVIRGKILEMNMAGDLRLETKDGSIFVYKAREVERIVRDRALTGRATDGYNEKKSYIGTSLGLVYSDRLERFGGHFNLVDMGYLFDRYIGLSLRLGGHAIPLSYTSVETTNGIHLLDDEKALTNIYIMAGPLFSLPGINPKDRFELRPMIGFSQMQYGPVELSGSKVSWELSAQYRRHLNETLDFFTGLSYFGVANYRDVTVNVGLGFRLR